MSQPIEMNPEPHLVTKIRTETWDTAAMLEEKPAGQHPFTN